MKQYIREEFLRRLESIEPGLSKRELIEQSRSFVFCDGYIRSFNDEIACCVPSDLGKEFRGAFPGQKLLEILRKLAEKEIGLEMQEGELLIHGERKQVGVRGEKEITLPINSVDEPGDWKGLPEDFLEAVSIVSKCASEEETLFTLTCVHIHPDWVEGCNDFQLCRWEMKTGMGPLLVRASSIKHMANLGMTEFSETSSWMHFRNANNVVLSCRKFLEEYPDFSKFLVVEGRKVELTKSLAEATERAQIFSVEAVEKTNYVLVELKPGKLRIKGEGLSGWYSEVKKTNYDGPPLGFMISPPLLMDLATKHSECIISEDRLKVNGDGKFVFVACLVKQ